MHMTPVKLYTLLLVMAASCGAVIWTQLKNKPVSYVQNTQSHAETEIFGGPFTLIDQHNRPFSLSNAKGKFVILYFGYTYCPDICPLGLSNITKALDLMGRDRDQFQAIFITVDPERDTVSTLHTYASNFKQPFVMLTGTQESINDVKKHYHVYAEKSKNQGTTEYVVDHSSYIYILDQNGCFAQNIPHDTAPEEMMRLMARLIVNTTIAKK